METIKESAIQTQIWKAIPRYEGYYQISNLGNIKSLSRTRKSGRGSVALTKERYLKTFQYKKGYLYCVLCKEGIRTNQSIHRLVAGAFLSNTDNKPCVNHKNGIKTDNSICNLEWVTKSENSLHSANVLGKKTRSKKVVCVETGKGYPSRFFAARLFNPNVKSPVSISKAIQSGKKAYGFHWRDNADRA
jgi:hypothetical protein